MNEYIWDFDDGAEYWYNDTYETIEECIEDALLTSKEEDEEYDTVYIGEVNKFIPTIDAERILDMLQEDAYEEVGEIGGDWNAYDYKKRNEIDELSEALTEVVHSWLKKCGYYPSFCTIENVKKYPLNLT